tara:strand:+ start:2677 stop:3021 length:345 start_codon:yes stop_codon:yes gene_type:complete
MNYVEFSESVCNEYYRQRSDVKNIINIDPALALVVAGVVLETIKTIKNCSEIFLVIREKFRGPTKIQISILKKNIAYEVGNDKELTDSILSSILETAYKLSDEQIEDLIKSTND